jgi:O-methyltransferase
MKLSPLTMQRLVRTLLRRLRARLTNSPSTLEDLDPTVVELIQTVRRRNLTFLPERKLGALAKLCNFARLAGSEGLFIEAGCALGGSAILLARQMPKNSELRVYDVFAMIPKPSERDGPDVHQRFETISRGKATGVGGDVYYGYQENLYERVCATFLEFGIVPNSERVHLIKGLVQDTLHVDAPVLLAHIDVDWYDPVLVCLERIVPQLSDDGFIVLDDYNDWSGCRRAVDDYFKGTKPQYEFDLSAGNLVIAKKSNQWVRSRALSL